MFRVAAHPSPSWSQISTASVAKRTPAGSVILAGSRIIYLLDDYPPADVALNLVVSKTAGAIRDGLRASAIPHPILFIPIPRPTLLLPTDTPLCLISSPSDRPTRHDRPGQEALPPLLSGLGKRTQTLAKTFMIPDIHTMEVLATLECL